MSPETMHRTQEEFPGTIRPPLGLAATPALKQSYSNSEEVRMFNRTLSAVTIGLALSLAAAGRAAAQEMSRQHPKGTQRTILGTVVDVSCMFGLGLSGSDHRMCAQVCADKGIPLAILSDDGTLYLPTSAAMPGDGQNARLKDFAEQPVTVTGIVFPAGGAQAIQIAAIRRKA
jgi:hypothetical protein